MQIQFSESIANLSAAITAAQSQMANAKKTSANPHFRSKYADLSEVLEVAKKPLNDNGLAIMQFPTTDPERSELVGVETLISHSSGEWIRSVLFLQLTKIGPQPAGSAITYARRYSLAAILGIAQEDDDGQTHHQEDSAGDVAEDRTAFEKLRHLFETKDFSVPNFHLAFEITHIDELKERPDHMRQAINSLMKKGDKK